MGAFEQALSNLGIEFDLVGYSEIDKNTAKAYSLIHNVDESLNLGDITKINIDEIGDFDLLVGGSPCQDISVANKSDSAKGLQGEKSSLFFYYERILNEKKPKYFVFENVNKLLSSNKGKDFEVVKNSFIKNYNIYYQVLNSKHFGVSQNRPRVFIVGIRKDIEQQFAFPVGNNSVVPLKEVVELGLEYDTRYYLTEQNLKSYTSPSRIERGWMFRTRDIETECGKCLTCKNSKQSASNTYIEDVHGIRGLTEREMFKVQGFDANLADYLKENGIKYSALCKMIGNSISVPVLERIFENLFFGNTLDSDEH